MRLGNSDTWSTLKMYECHRFIILRKHFTNKAFQKRKFVWFLMLDRKLSPGRFVTFLLKHFSR